MAITSPYADRLQAAMTTLQSRTPQASIAQPAPRPMDPSGIVPVNRTQPVAGDAGEARRLMEQRLGSMPPTSFPNTGIVPIERLGGLPSGPSMEAMRQLSFANNLPAASSPRAQAVRDALASGQMPSKVHEPRVHTDQPDDTNPGRPDVPRVPRDDVRDPSMKQRMNADQMARVAARRQSRVSRLQEWMANNPQIANNPRIQALLQSRGLLGV